MLIVCPSCATAYEVVSELLGSSGRPVRCVRCRTVWRTDRQAEELLAAAVALAPEGGSLDVPVGAIVGEIAATAAAAAGASAASGRIPSPDAVSGIDKALVASAGAPSADDAVVVEAPPIAPAGRGDGRSPIIIDAGRDGAEPGELLEDIETVAARRFQRGPKRRGYIWMLSRLQTAILALVIVDAIVIGWRTDIVRILPQTASLYAALGLPVNLRGLSFDDVATSMETHDKVPILVVEGKIVNDTAAVIDVPRLKLMVRNAAKQEIYSWTAVPPQARLSAYQEVAFRARLASPPPESHDVLVRFLNHRDFVAAEH